MFVFLADAIATADEKYPYDKIKFIKNTLIAFILILGVGIGFFLLDFVTDIQFSIDMQHMVERDISSEIEKCNVEIQRQNAEYTTNYTTCFETNSSMKERFNCMNFLNKLQQGASKCFNRGQHFDDKDQFQYMRDNLIIHIDNNDNI